MQKWEYCAVVGASGNSQRWWRELHFYNPDGVEVREEKELNMGVEIALLGTEGWEMVGTGSMREGSIHIIYFKRPIEA